MSDTAQILDRADRVISETVVAGSKIVTESRWHGDPYNRWRIHVYDASSEIAFDVTERTFPDSLGETAAVYHGKLERSARTREWIAARDDLPARVLLKAWRNVEGLTIDDAAAKLGSGGYSWGAWERGERVPYARYRENLERLTGIPASRWDV